MSEPAGDLAIWGVTTAGRRFRPADWVERLAGVTSVFGRNQNLVHSPPVRPISVHGVKAVVVGRALATFEPRLFQFFANFAHDNGLHVRYVENALATPESLVGLHAPMRDEPREPV